MKCKCNDQRHDLGTAVWHRAFCAWYDHERAGNHLRARAWGWFADRMARFA